MTGRDLLYILAVAVLVAWALTERRIARRAEERAFNVDTPIDLWPVSNVTVTDDWPIGYEKGASVTARNSTPPPSVHRVAPPPMTEAAGRDRDYCARCEIDLDKVSPDHMPPMPGESNWVAREDAARDRHPVGKGLRVVGGGEA